MTLALAPLLLLSVGLLDDSACTEGACRCAVRLANVVEGDTNITFAPGDLGGTVQNMFSRGGSQNIPVMCRAAKYWLDDDPEWYRTYFELQEAPGNPGWMHTEVLSPLYGR